MATQYISADVVMPVLRALRELGASVAKFKPSDAGLDSASADALMDAAAEQLGEAVGLRVAAEIPLGALGPVDYSLSMSSTVREALHRLARYYGVATERVELVVLESPLAGLEFIRRPAARDSRYWIEFSLALIVGRLRAGVGAPMKLEAVHFLHTAPSSIAEHEAYFGAPVTFGCPSDRLLFSRELLDQPLRTASPTLVRTLESKLDELEEKTQGDPVLRRARKAIADSLGREELAIDAVASRLAMSRRSLQRHLHEHGTSFRELVDDVRHIRAQHLLEERKMSTLEIAAELGFADTAAFFRAFRRWTGQTPRGRSS
jgi:AraC-like DNA-binding protein